MLSLFLNVHQIFPEFPSSDYSSSNDLSPTAICREFSFSIFKFSKSFLFGGRERSSQNANEYIHELM